MEQLESLARQGNATATLYFALSLSEETDRQAEEVEWLLRAYDLGFSDAAWNLAMVYNQNGDQENVINWIDKAAELGNTDAVLVAQLNYDVGRFLRAQH